MQVQKIESESLEHLGLVATIAKGLKIVQRIDSRLEKDVASKNVSMGQRILALIIANLQVITLTSLNPELPHIKSN